MIDEKRVSQRGEDELKERPELAKGETVRSRVIYHREAVVKRCKKHKMGMNLVVFK
jgi:hypothetical protein